MLSVLLIIVLSVNEKSASIRKSDSKIVGGREVLDAESIPFIVSIQLKDGGHNCGGSLLSPTYVLSACHCLADFETDPENVQPFPVESYLFVVGLIKLSDTTHAQIQTAKKFHIHPRCGKVPWAVMIYDFSIGEMKQPFAINEFVQPFKLLSYKSEAFARKMNSLMGEPGSVCLVAGWGVTQRGYIEKPEASDVLNVVRMYVIPETKCQLLYGARNPKFAEFPFSTFNQMCTVSLKSDASDCQGDSGGPFFCGEYVVGVVSYGFECGTPMPNVYTSLTDFLKWYTTEVRQSDHKDSTVSRSDNISTDGISERVREEEILPAEPIRKGGNHLWKPRISLILFIVCSQLAMCNLIPS